MKRQTHRKSQAKSHDRAQERFRRIVRPLGFVLLVGALVGAALASAKHIWSLNLAGCGPGAGCDKALRSAWASWFGWPTAFFGLAYFGALLTLWFVAVREAVPKLMRVAVWGGGAVSIMFVTVMLAGGYFCPYCLLTHVSNLALVAIVEGTARRWPGKAHLSWQQIAIGGLIFVGISVTAKVVELSEKLSAEKVAHAAAMESIAQMKNDESPDSTSTRVDTSQSVNAQSAVQPSATPEKKEAKPVTPVKRNFTGRYLRGNPNADVRIVVFHDYQCQLCKEAEAQIAQVMAGNNNVSFSVKHWPFDKSCNTELVTENMHPGACVAARIAEAVGSVGGEKAFWAVHDWLVARGGQVTMQEAFDLTQRIGLDRAKFEAALNSPIVDSLIQADIREGVRLGLTFTPMIFVNGYQLQGWQSVGAIPSAIARATELARTRPRTQDKPDLAIDVQFGQWQMSPVLPIETRNDFHTRGDANAKITVTVFGDLTCPFNAMAAATLDSIIGTRTDIRFCYRDFPLDESCNDLVKRKINIHACEAARLAEAAGQIGGANAYWQVRRWIISNRENFDSTKVGVAATACQLNSQALAAAMNSPNVTNAVAKDVADAKKLGIDTSPTIFVNGKRVVGWRVPGLLAKVIGSLGRI